MPEAIALLARRFGTKSIQYFNAMCADQRAFGLQMGDCKRIQAPAQRPQQGHRRR